VAGILKQFLRELPECIFTTAAYNRLFEAYAIQDQELRQDTRTCIHFRALAMTTFAGKKIRETELWELAENPRNRIMRIVEFYFLLQLMYVLESIDLFIEDQTFSPSYDLAPPPPLPSARSLYFSVFLCGAVRA